MNISKDEARILASALDHYSPYDSIESKEEANQIAHAINQLQEKLLKFSKDKRRVGRKSHNTFHDCMKRLTKKQ